MNKAEYLNKRNTLLAKMKDLIENNASDDEIKAVKDEIETLDNNYKTQATRMANMNALADNAVVADFEDSAVIIGSVVDSANVGGNAPVNDDAAHYENAFAKMMMGIPMNAAETTAFAKFNPSFSNDVGTTANNPAVIPVQRAEEIWSEMRATHPILEDILPNHFAGVYEFTKGEIGDNGSSWYDEEEEFKEDDVETFTASLTGCELSKSVTISWKLKKMSVKEFYNWLVRELSAKMGDALAVGYISGEGKPGSGETFKPQPMGIVTELTEEDGTPQVIVVPDGSELDYTTLTTARGKINSGYKPVIYANSETIWGDLANVVDKIGRPLFVPDPTGKGVGSVLGCIVKPESAVPTGGILFGDVAKGYVSNIADEMSITVDDEAKKHRTHYIAYMIVDGEPKTTKAFAYVTAGAAAATIDEDETPDE